MLHHIEYCLDEIDCEIDSHLGSKISEADCATLKTKLTEIRALIASWPVVEIAEEAAEIVSSCESMDIIELVADEAEVADAAETIVTETAETNEAPVEIVELIAETAEITETEITETVEAPVEIVEVIAETAEISETIDASVVELIVETAEITADEITETIDAPVEIVELIAETAEITETEITETVEAPVASVELIAETAEITAIAESSTDNLLLIRGVDAETAALLGEKGVTFAAITDWRAANVADLALDARRVAKEGWIEQAAVLATGRLTHYAARVERGELACLVATTEEKAIAILETSSDMASETETPAPAEAIEETLAPTLIVSSSYLPPVFDGTCPAKVEDKAEIEPAKAEIAACKDETNAETVAAAASNVIALPPRNRDHKWLRRASLAASLLLLMSVGILGMQHKLPSTSTIQQIVSVD